MTEPEKRHSALIFKGLFKKAIEDWPLEVDLSVIKYSDPFSVRYEVIGLGPLSDEIADNYIGTDQEIIMRNLHDAIFIVLHRVAPLCRALRVIRPVRFEKCGRLG